jgi:hypothetical protein
MAEGLNDERRQLSAASDDHAAEAPLSAGVGVGQGRRTERASSPHSAKFRAATAMLIGIAIGALVVAGLVIVGGSHGGSTGKWSSWAPTDSGSLGTREIADHIAPLYRISGTDQLDVVTVVNLQSAATAPTTSAASSTSSSSSGLQVAVRADPSKSAVSLLNGKTVAYNLCGVGSPNCVIGVGKASTDRLLLLRREALELALYTFKYIGGAQNVVAILPPGRTTQGCSGICPKPNTKTTTKPLNMAILFVHDELAPWLGRPLSDTLPLQFPPAVPQLSLWRQTPEASLVDQITARGLFSERLSSAQDGSNLIVLEPLPPS